MAKLMMRIARFLAICGGIVLTALVVLTCVSVLGRGLNTLGHSDLLTGLSEAAASALINTGVGPVKGDFELVEAGVAFAIFAFLPICQLLGAHATVDIFTSKLPLRVNRALVAFWEVVLTVIIVLITVRLFAGLQDVHRYGDTTFILQFPQWWAFAASFAAALVASVVAVYCAVARLTEAMTGRAILPRSVETVH